MKVLSIGNSFSEDSQKWLNKLAATNDYDLYCVNLFVGGCSLKRHWDHITQGLSPYRLEINGEYTDKSISIEEGLSMGEWDVITLQQASPNSGQPQSYIPYITKLTDYVKERCPKAKIYFHQTWAYEIDLQSASFEKYNSDQAEMFRRIKDASEMATKLINVEIIPTGSVIQKIRETVPEFDFANGGLSLNRDGAHLSLDYGRYTASAVWYRTLTGNKLIVKPFQDFDAAILQKIADVVNEF